MSKTLTIFSYLNSRVISVPKNYSHRIKQCCMHNTGSKDVCQSKLLHIYASEKLETIKIYNNREVWVNTSIVIPSKSRGFGICSTCWGRIKIKEGKDIHTISFWENGRRKHSVSIMILFLLNRKYIYSQPEIVMWDLFSFLIFFFISLYTFLPCYLELCLSPCSFPHAED